MVPDYKPGWRILGVTVFLVLGTQGLTRAAPLLAAGWSFCALPCGSLLTEGGRPWGHQSHGERNEGQHEFNDQGPQLRPSAVDVLQEFSVYVSVSYVSQASYQRSSCHGLRLSQGIRLVLQSWRVKGGAGRPPGSTEEIFAVLAALGHRVGFHCHASLTPLFPPNTCLLLCLLISYSLAWYAGCLYPFVTLCTHVLCLLLSEARFLRLVIRKNSRYIFFLFTATFQEGHASGRPHSREKKQRTVNRRS